MATAKDQELASQGTIAMKSATCSSFRSVGGASVAEESTPAPPVEEQRLSQSAPTLSAKVPPLALWSPALRVPFWEHFLPLVYSPGETADILDSIVTGVRIGRPPADSIIINHNWPSAIEFHDQVTAIIHADLQAGKLLGPFLDPPFENYIISPLGAFQKRNSTKVRLIHDLSYPAKGSVNSLIDPADFSLSYASIDDAVDFIAKLDSPSIYMSKMDLKDAYKTIFIAPNDWHLMGFTWHDASGRCQHYFSKVLNFGLRSAPYLFDTIASPLARIMHHRGVCESMLRYVDDFLILATSEEECAHNLALMLDTANKAGFQIQDSKVTAPSEIIEFLGIVIDTRRGELRISQERLDDLREEVKSWLNLGTITKRRLLSILGKCSFAARVIRSGRPFLARLFTAAKSVGPLHFKIRLSQEARSDLRWWVACIESHNGVSVYRPNWLVNVKHIWTDASSTGFGAFDGYEWFSLSYEGSRKWMLNHSINWREMHAAVAALYTWGPQIRNANVIFHIDNTSACNILNKGHSPVPSLMFFARHWFMAVETFNLNVAPVYIPTELNVDADDLSRLRVSEFKVRNPDASPTPTWPDESFLTFDF